MMDGKETSSSFLGTGWSFPPTFTNSGKDLVMASGEEDIEASLRILLSTSVGERFLQPRYGCSLDHLLFERLSTGVKTYVRGLIESAILLFEPRIDLDNIDFVADGEAEGRLDIVVEYTVRTTNSRYNLVYPFYQP